MKNNNEKSMITLAYDPILGLKMVKIPQFPATSGFIPRPNKKKKKKF